MSERIEQEILSLATEDYQGLWEIRSQVEQLPDIDEARLPEMLAEAFERLLAQDRVRLYRGALLGPEAIPIAHEEAWRLVRRPESWSLPDGRRDDLSVAATPEGERTYFGSKAQ